MGCCAKCFGDPYLEREIIPALSRATGKCDYCGTENRELVDPRELRVNFELLTGIYVESEDGRLLVDWLRDDWSMFPHLDTAHAKELLADILDDGEIVRQCFRPADAGPSEALDTWNHLRAELMHENRFFPEPQLDKARLAEFLSYLVLTVGSIQTEWFRARIMESSDPYPPDKMGAPPKHLARHGRANPAGIPYLYLASDPTTAVAELRPHTGEFVCIAKFQLPDNASVVDLRAPRVTVSPFMLAGENEIELVRKDIAFLEQLGNELTRPVLPQAAAIDYTPSQYLCEFIKACSFDGVLYRSSVGAGINLAMFAPSEAEFVELHVDQVRQVRVELTSENVC